MMLCRLNSSSYMEPDFISQELNLAQNLGLDYCVGLNELKKPYSDTILITNTHTKVDDLPNELMDKVVLLIHPNSGHDNLPHGWVKKQRFPIILGNEIRAHAVTNTILSHLLGHYSPIGHQESWSSDRIYNRKLLSELTVHVIGHGHIGKLLESSLSSLVKEIVITDINFKDQLSLNKVFDVIIPVPSLTKSSRHMVNGRYLKKQAEDFCLINCSRGEIVKTSDLLEVLKTRKKAYAYLDVFEKEPCDFSLFKSFPNIKTTSHIAGVFKKIAKDTIIFEKSVLDNFLNLDKDSFLKKYSTSLLNNKNIREFP